MGYIAKFDFILYMSNDKLWVWRVFVKEDINYLYIIVLDKTTREPKQKMLGEI